MAHAENHLLARLQADDRASIVAAGQPVQLTLGTVLCEPGQRMRHVYFPEDCLVSLVTGEAGQPGLAVGLVGREGMLGTPLALGVRTMPLQALVQGAGGALRIATTPFRRELLRNKGLQQSLSRYVYVLMTQLASATACMRFHSVEPRLARWLLMTQDRARSSDFHITHEFLAHMLGVRRVGITAAAGALQRRGLIRYHRGHITVLERAGLEATACSCYAADRHIYRVTLG
jgi:CRP-like cAMP-binding protein